MNDISTHFQHGAHLLKELDETDEQWRDLVQLAFSLKRAKKRGEEKQYMKGRRIALIFEKTSTRTRCAFEVAAADQGATTTYLDPTSSQIGHKESIADTAKVLGRFYDGIEYRGTEQETVETLAEHAGVPTWNGLTDSWHPTQMLADSLTMLEHSPGKDFTDIAYAYVGDARFNTGRSLLINGAMLGCDVRIVAPKALWPDQSVIDMAHKRAKRTGAKIVLSANPADVKGVDFLHTDVWVSMGEPKEIWAERVAKLRPYRVTAELMTLAGSNTKFMHCLPAFHDLNTTVGKKVSETFGLEGIEVTDQVFNGPNSIVFDQAENRMHTIKAAMVRSLGR